MESVRDFIAKTLEGKGISLYDASLQIGQNQTYLQQYVKYGKPKRGLPEHVREALAPIMDVPPDRLKQANGQERPSPFRVSARNGLIPVVGIVDAGDDDDFLFDGENITEERERPPALNGVSGAFAVYVRGDSCEPKYQPGQLLYVHPTRPYRRGDWVVVRKLNGKGLIKRFIGWDKGMLRLERLSPKQSEILVPKDELVGIFKVVHADEA